MATTMSKDEEFYGPVLARIHDEGFGAHAREAVPFVLERLRRAGHRGGRVVEFGCGGGELAAALVAAGYDVHGYDVSEAMLQRARTRAPAARFERASWTELQLPPVVAVLAIGEVLNYTHDPRVDGEALAAFFARVHAALVPGGLLVFDIAQPGRCPGGTTERAVVHADWAVFARSTEDGERPELTRAITAFVADGERYRRIEETHRLRLHPGDWVARELARCGFVVERPRSYSGRDLPPGLEPFVAQRG